MAELLWPLTRLFIIPILFIVFVPANVAAQSLKPAEPSLAPSPTPSESQNSAVITGTTPAATPTPATPTAKATANTPTTPGRSSFRLPESKANPMRVPRFDKAPVIDGKLDEEVWKHAAVFKDFYQTQPGDNITPSQPTEAFMGYDSTFFYLGFHCYDEPGKVRATIPKRDGIFDVGDDSIRVLLDTFNDQRRAYVLVFNPFGVQQDGIRTEGVGVDFTVDIVMESKGMLTADGYTVEVAIPFKSLRYEAGKDKLWGLQIFRQIQHYNESDSWMPISRDKAGILNQAGHIMGLEGISAARTLEFIPSLTLSETGKRVRSIPTSILETMPVPFDPGRFVNKPIKSEFGLTAKFGITSTVTLDVALNPDFAQVEADQPVVTANQRFPIFFPEKRPFFLEGKDYFDTPATVVHTRAIIDPDVAVKLTGKRGRNTFGLLLASDNAPGNFTEEERADPDLLPSIRRFLDKNAYIGVLRLKRDLGKENSLGLIATTYNFIERHNDVLGFDGRFKLNKQTTFNFQVIGTTSRRFLTDPDTRVRRYRTGNGFGYSTSLNKEGRHFGYSFNGIGFTRFYRADVGFTRRTNSNTEKLFLYYQSDPKPKAKLVRWQVNNVSTTIFDWQGRQHNWGDESSVELDFARQITFIGGYLRGYERLLAEEFSGGFFGPNTERATDINTYYVYAGATPSKKYSGSVFLSTTRGAFDLDFGAGPRFPRISPAALSNPNARLDPGPGNSLDMEITAAYQPTNALRTSLNYTKSRLVRFDTGRTAFDENLFSWRTTYQFTRFIFARARLDYATLESNVRGQYLLGWTPNPGTAFYVGYNDNSNFRGFNPFTGQAEPGFQRNNRVFFIKLTYLIRHGL
jgi:hypothetical protein